jgi:hypothetical protein
MVRPDGIPEELDALIAQVEAAAGPDRELDLAIAKALALIPADAEWQQPESGDLMPIFAKFLGKWETPAHREALSEWKRGLDAFFASPEYRSGGDSYVRENPYPGTFDKPGSGSLPSYTSSIDAALALMTRVLPAERKWRLSMDQMKDGWDADLSEPGNRSGVFSVTAKTLPLSIILATLLAIRKGAQ